MKREIEGKKKRELKVSLPLSLIESEILPRLPAKSIGVCRRVCKQCKSFLSSPTFCRMHLSYHATIDDYKLLLFDGVTLGTLPLSGTIPCNLPDLSLKLGPKRGLPVSFHFSIEKNPLTGAYRKLSSIDRDDYDLHYFHSSSDIPNLTAPPTPQQQQVVLLQQAVSIVKRQLQLIVGEGSSSKMAKVISEIAKEAPSSCGELTVVRFAGPGCPRSKIKKLQSPQGG
ncbi:hypothetical protein QVD17_30911 [Tagetes erecta]|uniref:F-box domain-containing protein n=1 Tax=Tagetes erecta TaxID=13708 RepID=A0AAD8K3L9_TARER|nr:hypothetical protein QVD17_30911 [Tagetes erecta]